MKKKLMALFLALSMAVSLVTPAFAAGGLFPGLGKDHLKARDVEIALKKDKDKAVKKATVNLFQRTELLVNELDLDGLDFQWQIAVPDQDLWVDIQGEDEIGLDLSYAKVASLLNEDGEALVRCELTLGDVTVHSPEITVDVDEDTKPEPTPVKHKKPVVLKGPQVVIHDKAPAEKPLPPAEKPEPPAPPVEKPVPPAPVVPEAPVVPPVQQEPEVVPEVVPEVEPEDPATELDRTGLDESVVAVYNHRSAPLTASTNLIVAETPELQATYNVVIKYVFKDGKQAANPWTGTVLAGNSLDKTIISPDVLGYTPDQAEVNLAHVTIDGDKTIEVTYAPANVGITVNHYQQNLKDDEYSLIKSEENVAGYTENAVGEGLQLTEEELPGFKALLYDTETKIAADGSTVVEIYYDRLYYLMNFDLNGGYGDGVEPIYARYGAAVEAGTPTRPGYTFAGWKDVDTGTEYQVGSFPYTAMPAKNTKFEAQWRSGNTTYDVVFWYENADDDGYSQAGVLNDVLAAAGETVNGSSHANSNFTGRDADHFTYHHADSNVVVKGDGSTVVNVYFSRNVYTLTFIGDVLTCTRVEHEHSHDECCTRTSYHSFWDCNTNKCPNNGEEHTHSDNCYSERTILTVTEKYDADISSVWLNDSIKAILDSGDAFTWSETDAQVSFMEKMPGVDSTMTQYDYSGSNKYHWFYYLEVLPGQSTDGLTIKKTADGKTYYEYDDSVVYSSDLTLTYDDDYYPITGFDQLYDKGEGGWDYSSRYGCYTHSLAYNKSAGEYQAFLYYTRNSYELTFSNYGTPVAGKGGTILYEADISGKNFTPDYPSTLEANAYVFDGWYTSPYFGDTKFNFTSATMPANDLTLYARWVPKEHKVNVYLTEEMKASDKLCEEQTVDHRDFADEPDEPERGQYSFVGWFYMDGETEKAFDFSMPITKDMNIYAKWNTDTQVPYIIHYELADGTKVAPDTTGYALHDTTKTFDAKIGEELYKNDEVNYQSGYFPHTNSHSITIDIEGSNEFTFVYESKEAVPYVVKYLEKGTGNVLIKQKSGSTKDAVITETFEPFEGYRPDAYQKQLILSTDETKNVITFWYTKDDVHAPVQVIHYIQYAEGEDYTVYQSSTDLDGEINKSYSAKVLTIDGYTYHHATANGADTGAVDGTVTATVTDEGLLLELYYNRNEYPYEFRFLEQGTEKVLATAVTGKARYGSQVTQKAKSIPGYICVSDKAQAITIQKEETNNVRTFYYTEQEVTINYVVKGPADCGTVTPTSETVKVFSGDASGSTPTAADGYRFVGWFTDEACTSPVDGTWVTNNKINPAKVNGKNVAATYYAKFEHDTTSLTIEKTGTNIDANQTFIFNVKGDGVDMDVVITGTGSVTIDGLTVGATYTVTEDIDWSWRYKQESVTGLDQNNQIQLAASGNQVTFTNKKTNSNWLSGVCYAVNNWMASKLEGN